MAPQNLLLDMREEVNKTVDRIIVGIDLHMDNIQTNVVSMARINIGIGVATVEAFDAGAASLPGPGVTEEYPVRGWLWRWAGLCQYENATDHGVEVYKFPRLDFDLRASRKIDKGILFLAAANFAQQGAVDVEMTGLFRCHILTG